MSPAPLHPALEHLLGKLPELLEDFSSPHRSLDQIAAKHDTNVRTLSLLIALPQARRAIDQLAIAAAAHIRLTALALMPDALHALGTMIREYSYDAEHIPLRNDFPTLILKERQRTNARRAVHLLTRLTNFTPKPLPEAVISAPAATSPPTQARGTGLQPVSTPSTSPTPEPPSPLAPTQPSEMGILPVSTPSTSPTPQTSLAHPSAPLRLRKPAAQASRVSQLLPSPPHPAISSPTQVHAARASPSPPARPKNKNAPARTASAPVIHPKNSHPSEPFPRF